MTDTITAVIDSTIVLPDSIVRHGYGAEVADCRALYEQTTVEQLRAIEPALRHWVAEPGIARDNTFVDRLLAHDALGNTDVHYFAAALYGAHVEQTVRFGATPRFTLSTTIEQLLADTHALLGSVREQWLAWAAETSQPLPWARWMAGGDGAWVGPANFTRDLRDFIAWATAHPTLFADRSEMTDTTTVPSGDTAVAVPIGPEHPGWDAFWKNVAEYAEEDGYQEQYNILARAFGAAEIEDADNREIEVTFELDVTMRVTVTQTMTYRDYDDGDYTIQQGDVDEAIRAFTHREDADYEVYDSTYEDA